VSSASWRASRAAGAPAHGVGTRLLDAGLAACRRHGVTRLTVAVERDNAAARRFYRSRGFAEVGVRRLAVPGYVLELVECERAVPGET
jgi:ribosomal protein S18 acetylase RimI-like enzyme